MKAVVLYDAGDIRFDDVPDPVIEQPTDDQAIPLSDIFPTGFFGTKLAEVEPTDVLPMIGLGPVIENVWVATGLSDVGLTLGTVAATTIANGISGHSTPLADALSPSRPALSMDWVNEQSTAATNMIKRIVPASDVDPSILRIGEGKVGTEGHAQLE